jgi:hypothetical protein
MGAGNKKNKRGSIPTLSQKTEQRTPDNDYGVLSDPDEVTPPVITGEESSTATATATEPSSSQQRDEQWRQELPRDDIHTEQSPLSDSQPSSQPSSQEQPPSSQLSSPSLQPQKPESQLSPSLKALQLKLSRDKKMTLHTFFSYIILALEMERASSTSIASISPDNVQHLIEYMIEHHSETDAVRIYLQTLIDTGVVKNLIESIIEFNKDQTEAFNKLITTEQIELELAASIQESRVTTTTTTESPQTPQDSATSSSTRSGSGSFFKRLFTSCLCCCLRRRRHRRSSDSHIIPQPVIDAEMTTTQPETMAVAEAVAVAEAQDAQDPQPE